MLNQLCLYEDAYSFSLSPENPTGEKGKGGMALESAYSEYARDLGQGWKVSPFIKMMPGQTYTIADIKGEGAIKHIWMGHGCPRSRGVVLRIYWDGSDTPSVEAPLGDFFASAMYGNIHSEYRQLSSLAVCQNPRNGANCYWEMPYKKGFVITVENVSEEEFILAYQIDCERKKIPDNALYFHAQYRRVNPLPYKEVYTILDNVRGKGKYVGTYLHWGVHNNGWWGEGEIKFYLDGDSDFPTICGTGTEDYFCASFNFEVSGAYREFCTPYTGMYKVGETDETYKSQRRFNMYRWHITDPIYFHEDIRVTIQALGWRSYKRYLPLQDDISSVAFWYQDGICKSFPAFPDRDSLEIV